MTAIAKTLYKCEEKTLVVFPTRFIAEWASKMRLEFILAEGKTPEAKCEFWEMLYRQHHKQACEKVRTISQGDVFMLLKQRQHGIFKILTPDGFVGWIAPCNGIWRWIVGAGE